MFQIGDRVIRTSEPSTRVGEVVEVLDDGRVRVLWEALAGGDTGYNHDRAKRTYIKAEALAPATPANIESAAHNVWVMRWNYQHASRGGRIIRSRARPYRPYQGAAPAVEDPLGPPDQGGRELTPAEARWLDDEEAAADSR